MALGRKSIRPRRSRGVLHILKRQCCPKSLLSLRENKLKKDTPSRWIYDYFSPYEVHKHAHQLEHAMTPLVVEKLAEFLNNPKFCPHGTPMPGTTLPKNTISLMESEPGMTVEVAMIGEVLEDSVDLMKILHEHRIMPGNQHKVVERTEVMRSISLESKDGPSTLPFHVAKNIFVIQIPSD